MAELLKRAGYDTAIVGKWHLGLSNFTTMNGLLPTHHGFDSFYGLPLTNVRTCLPVSPLQVAELLLSRTKYVWLTILLAVVIGRAVGLIKRWRVVLVLLLVEVVFIALFYYYASSFTLLSRQSCILMRNDTVVEQPYRVDTLTPRLTAEAVRFIRQHREPGSRPFFLYFASEKVHTALASPAEFRGRSPLGPYGDSVAELDWSVGQLLAALRAGSAERDTLVVFSSDNGPFLEEGHEGGSAGPLRGGKGQNWEGGIRVPMLLRWPAVVRGPRTVDTPLSHMDLYATVVELLRSTGHAVDIDKVELDGESLLGRLTDPTRDGDDGTGRYLFHYCGPTITAVRHGRWKAHFATTEADDGVACPGRVICDCMGRNHDPPLLFDLADDVGERRPLRPDHPAYAEVVADLAAAKHRQEQRLVPAPSRLEHYPRPWLFPCCNPPACQCEEPLGDLLKSG